MFLRIFLTSTLFMLIVHADSVPTKEEIIHAKVQNLIGINSYGVNKNFINKIFSNKDRFFNGNKLNIVSVLNILKDNGLLSLKLSKPSETSATFISNTKPIFLLKSLSHTLGFLGYSYYTISEASFIDDITNINVKLIAEHIIDPLSLSNELRKYGFNIDDIRVEGKEWIYHLTLASAKIPYSTELEGNSSVNIAEVSGEYWFSLPKPFEGKDEEFNVLKITSTRRQDLKIIYFDKYLQLIALTNFQDSRNVRLNLKEGTKFIYITDPNNPFNLRNGLSVSLLN